MTQREGRQLQPVVGTERYRNTGDTASVSSVRTPRADSPVLGPVDRGEGCGGHALWALLADSEKRCKSGQSAWVERVAGCRMLEATHEFCLLRFELLSGDDALVAQGSQSFDLRYGVSIRVGSLDGCRLCGLVRLLQVAEGPDDSICLVLQSRFVI